MATTSSDENVSITISKETIKSVKMLALVIIVGIIVVAGGLFLKERALDPAAQSVSSSADDIRARSLVKEYGESGGYKVVATTPLSKAEGMALLFKTWASNPEMTEIVRSLNDTSRYPKVFFYEVDVIESDGTSSRTVWWAWQNSNGQWGAGYPDL